MKVATLAGLTPVAEVAAGLAGAKGLDATGATVTAVALELGAKTWGAAGAVGAADGLGHTV